jgi:NAD(P)-dependent dehydrogenase (short-subunit alcohol dehydrogenase family)
MPASENRVALITGASGGLGSAVASSFLDAGMKVAGVARQWKIPPGGVGFVALEGDLTSAEGADAVVHAAVTAFGRLDALIHLAGGFSGGEPLEKTPPEVFDRMMNLNLHTGVNVMRAAVPHMKKAGKGRILAVGSRAGLEPSTGLSAYAASKAALHATMQSLAAELKPYAITVNAVLPSTIDTAANRAAMPKADPSTWVSPASIASLMLWLCSEEARDVTGALIPIYGRS